MNRVPGALAFVLLLACGAAAPPMVPSRTCTSASGLRVELEQQDATADLCSWSAMMLDGYRGEYEAQWGALDLAGWTIRIRLGATFNGEHLGTTWNDDRTIDLVDGQWRMFPHELNHVRRGPTHDGWCAAFEPWEESELGFDERGYLRCP